MMTKTFKYPEVVHDHFQNHHSVNDHNAKRHSPISIDEAVWATKQWPNCVFAFLFVITKVNCFLLESHFTSRKHDSMMDYRKELTKCIDQESVFGTRGVGREVKIHKNLARNQSWVGVTPTVPKIFWQVNAQIYITIPPKKVHPLPP